MRRIAFVFFVAVFIPSLVLGLLALRTAGEQRGILERQSAALYQHDTDAAAAHLREQMLARQREFAASVHARLHDRTPAALADSFSRDFQETGAVAFAVTPAGVVITPRAAGRDVARFQRENEAFLNSRAEAEVFPTQQNTFQLPPKVLPAGPDAKAARKVTPQSNSWSEEVSANASRVTAQISNFQTITSGDSDGLLARFNQNELELILWTRPPGADNYRFGLALSAAAIRAFVKTAFLSFVSPKPDACLAVLDENARPVARTIPEFSADWRRPFVASEIGEILPHWEVALYLREPEQFAQSARLITLTLVLLIALALAAILGGGTFVALDARRQMALARQKTDFVSNVSHELKTPLTSIRMFAELLEENRVSDPEKRSRYLRIIRAESERLTRLINNVLDFARFEKSRSPEHRVVVDLHPLLANLWDTHTARLRDAGFTCEWEPSPAPYPVLADPDAIGQVLINLLSNAEKYAGKKREITLRSEATDEAVTVSVLDRGIGVPPGEGRRIFHAFQRGHDSLAGGIPGSGLGLTLAENIARRHGGSLAFERREGGGSIFTLRLPRHHPEETA